MTEAGQRCILSPLLPGKREVTPLGQPGEEAIQHRVRRPHAGSAPAELLENTTLAAANCCATEGASHRDPVGEGWGQPSEEQGSAGHGLRRG